MHFHLRIHSVSCHTLQFELGVHGLRAAAGPGEKACWGVLTPSTLLTLGL
jgi:hypothetical protein